MISVLNYGGGRQTVAICVLIGQGILPRPDRIVMADTGREKQSTWDYLDSHIRPFLARHDLTVEIAPHSLATVDIYGKNGDLLLPAFTKTGKFPAYCSGEWKARVVARYLGGEDKNRTHWIGFSYDERRRIKGTDGRWFPLVEHMLTSADCGLITQRAGLPPAPRSACWFCPNMKNREWRNLRDEVPAQFALACDKDDELRADDIAAGGSGVWLHFSRVPLRAADIDARDKRDVVRQCGLGLCHV